MSEITDSNSVTESDVTESQPHAFRSLNGAPQCAATLGTLADPRRCGLLPSAPVHGPLPLLLTPSTNMTDDEADELRARFAATRARATAPEPGRRALDETAHIDVVFDTPPAESPLPVRLPRRDADGLCRCGAFNGDAHAWGFHT